MGSSLINFDQFLSSWWNACAKMEVCVWDRTADIQFSVCVLSPLHVSILASSARFCPSLCCLRLYTTRTKHLVLPRCLERKLTLLHCWVMPVLTAAILLWRSKQDSDFFSSGLLFCHSALCGISLASKKQMNVIRLLHIEQQSFQTACLTCFLNIRRDCFYCLPRETIPLPICFLRCDSHPDI